MSSQNRSSPVGRGLVIVCVCAFSFAGIPVQSGSIADARIAAVIDGNITITREQVDASIGARLFALEEKIYALRKNALESLIREAVLQKEASRRNVTLPELKKLLATADVNVDPDAVNETYLENVEALGRMSEDEAKERIRLDLESRERLSHYKSAVSQLLAQSSIEQFLQPPPPPAAIGRATGPRKGSEDAPVTIVEFSDFECPYCRSVLGDLRRVLAQYGSDVALVYKHMPLPTHPNAFKAAQAAVCADQQGKFWEYHDGLFQSADLENESLARLAADVGLRTDRFRECMTSEGSATAVRSDVRAARQAGVQGTPTFLINGKVVANSSELGELRAAIDEALRQHRVAQASTPVRTTSTRGADGSANP